MVNVIKPEEEWRVVFLASSRNCPFLYYPNSILRYRPTRCEKLSKDVGDTVPCSKDLCPLKTSYQTPDRDKWDLDLPTDR